MKKRVSDFLMIRSNLPDPRYEFQNKDIFRVMTTPSEFAKLSHYDIRTIQIWCDEGKVNAMKVGGVWIIERASIEAFVKTRESSQKSD